MEWIDLSTYETGALSETTRITFKVDGGTIVAFVRNGSLIIESPDCPVVQPQAANRLKIKVDRYWNDA